MNALCVSALLLAPAVHAAVRAYTALHRLHALSLTTDNPVQYALQCQVSVIREDQRHDKRNARSTSLAWAHLNETAERRVSALCSK